MRREKKIYGLCSTISALNFDMALQWKAKHIESKWATKSHFLCYNEKKRHKNRSWMKSAEEH